MVALGEVVGTESRGLSADTIAALPSVSYKAENAQDGSAEQYAFPFRLFAVVIYVRCDISLVTIK